MDLITYPCLWLVGRLHVAVWPYFYMAEKRGGGGGGEILHFRPKLWKPRDQILQMRGLACLLTSYMAPHFEHPVTVTWLPMPAAWGTTSVFWMWEMSISKSSVISWEWGDVGSVFKPEPAAGVLKQSLAVVDRRHMELVPVSSLAKAVGHISRSQMSNARQTPP